MSERKLINPFENLTLLPKPHATATKATEPCPICGLRFNVEQITQHVNLCIDENAARELQMSMYQEVDRQFREDIQIEDINPSNVDAFDCPICFEPTKTGNGYEFECKHKYCGECLEDYYTSMIMNGKADQIVCPDPTCKRACTYQDVRFILPDAMFEKYKEFMRNSVIDKDPNQRWCPNPTGCGTVCKGDANTTKMTCHTCNYSFCFKCQDTWHPNRTCEQYAKWKMLRTTHAEWRVAIWKKMNSKNCPKCNANIQKHGGCNHMTCFKCNYEFCWQCLRQYDSDHFDDGWCSMYGRVAGINYFGHGAKRIWYKMSENFSLSEMKENLSDRWEDTRDALGDKWEDTKDSMGEKWQGSKEKMSEGLSRFKSLFSRQ